jgi:CO/xanthine dehydrogenase Mo-binding subunit
VITDKKICRRGDVVAPVAADTREHAREAAKNVKQNLEVLPTHPTFPEAVMPGALDIHPGIPNFYMEQRVFIGEDTADLFEDAPFVAEGSFQSQHEPHFTIEPDTLQGYWGADGMLTPQCKSHSLADAKDALSAACGIPKENLRLLMNASGAAFGYSVCPNTFALVVTAVQNLDVPCSFTLSYDEFNHTTGKRMATFSDGRIACDEDGTIIAAEYDVASDHGAYGFVPTFLNLTSLGFYGYNIPNFKALGRGGTSNHNSNTAYRGFGSPQISTTTEALIDMCAEKAGIDVAGNATIDAANQLMDAMRKEDGTYRTYDEMVAAGIPTKYVGHYDQFNIGLDPGLDPNTGEGHRVPAFMYCVNVALVEVDVDTGKTQVLRFTWVGDVGVIGNRLSVEGQGYGGLSHAIGFALFENYDAEDKHGNMIGCGVPRIDMIPDDINLVFLETPRAFGPHGSSGSAEVFQSCNHMAVINGINNACGVRIYALPATPDKVKAAWQAKQRGEDLTPPKYFLGSDFEEELEWIKANPV